MIDLKAQFGHIFKIMKDESAEIPGQSAEDRLWLYQIPCRFGHIYVHGRETLGAYTKRRRLIPGLLAIPGATLHQRGDAEATILFPPDQLEVAAQLLQAKRRRKLTEEQRAKFVEAGSKHRFPSGVKA